MDNCILKPVWSTLKPVILAKFLTGANNPTDRVPCSLQRAVRATVLKRSNCQG